MSTDKKPLGEMLVEKGVISAQDLKVALEAQRQMPAPLGVTLVELGMAKEEQILPILHQQLNRIDVILAPGDDIVKRISSVTDALQYLMELAVNEGGTDLHLEPTAIGVKVRIRIDGILHQVGAPPVLCTQYPAAVPRVKILCSLDISEKRIPQDGRATFKVMGKELDIRVSVLPSQYGESIAIRILQSQATPLELSNIGLNPKVYEVLLKVLQRNNGLILVTGPTGSGKTTTLYACLDSLNDSTKKIVTVEDPIEYTLPGVIQMQVQPSINLTFTRLLRSVLRHDPNILMVGEIRDTETADVSIRMALTGHLVFSTIHTSDAASTIARLLDMGIEPYLVSSSLSCVIAERLVRTVCRFCKGKRCISCLGLGLKGRTGIFECLIVNEELRKLILKRPTADEIRQRVKKYGMVTLREEGAEKIKAGITTREELDRVIHSDDL